MKKLLRQLFNAESVSVFASAMWNYITNAFISIVMIGFACGVGMLISLPIVAALAFLTDIPGSVVKLIPKIFGTITGITGIFLVIESKIGEHTNKNNNYSIDVAITVYIAAMIQLWKYW